MSQRSNHRKRRDSGDTEQPPYSLQDSILTALAFDDTYGAKVAAQVSPEYFSEAAHYPLAEQLLNYWSRYGRPPGRAHLDDIIDMATLQPKTRDGIIQLIAAMTVQFEDGFNAKFVADQVGVWLGRQLRIRTIMDAADLVDGSASEDEIDQQLLQGVKAAQAVTMVEPPKVLTGAEFCALRLKEPEVLIEPWLESGTSILVHAPRGEGKTCLMMHTAIRLAHGRLPVFTGDAEDDYSYRWDVKRSARVLFVDGEMSAETFQRRLTRFGKIPPRFFVLNTDHEKRQGRPLGSLYERRNRVALDRYIEACEADVVVLDNIFHLFGGVGDKELERWSEVNDTWVKDHKSARRTIILIHHEPKGSPGSSYGSVIREAAVDVRMALAPIKPQPTDGSTIRLINIHKGRELDSTQKVSFAVRLRLVNDRYIWTAEDAPEGGAPGRPKSSEAEEKRREIVELAAKGKTNREIAGIVGVSEQYVGRILREEEEAREN